MNNDVLNESIRRLEQKIDEAALFLKQRNQLLEALENVVDMLHNGDLIKNPERESNELSVKMVHVLEPLLQILEDKKRRERWFF